MNLFVLDENPTLAAQYLDDKRIGSALREVNQMMSVALHQNAIEGMEVGPGLLCRPSHQQHPVTLWVGQTRGNFIWALAYAYACIEEWQVRYGTVHGSGLRTPYIGTYIACIPDGPLLPFQNSAKNVGLDMDFSDLEVPVSYREYLKERWLTDKRPALYTNRGYPWWTQ